MMVDPAFTLQTFTMLNGFLGLPPFPAPNDWSYAFGAVVFAIGLVYAVGECAQLTA